MTNYRVAFYSADSHIKYNLKTLQRTGVGGGITARTHIAHALHDIGHDVTMYVNCPRDEDISGVKYRHFSKVKKIEADVLVLSTSGGELDFSPLLEISIHANLQLLMLSGVEFPKHIRDEDYSYVYLPSNFMRHVAVQKWQMESRKVFITHYGITEKNFNAVNSNRRDPYKLLYMSHPSKGQEAALAVLKVLLNSDPRFQLHLYGGVQLWGEKEEQVREQKGVVYYGLMGQKKLARSISACGFCLNLQTREEPFGIVIMESMKAGCIVLASPVGAYPELIRNGYNGFLIPGDPEDPAIHNKAAATILDLLHHPDYLEYVRQNAINTPFDWKIIAKAWENHWDWHNNSSLTNDPLVTSAPCCLECRGQLLRLADGLHCVRCGNYQQFHESTIDK